MTFTTTNLDDTAGDKGRVLLLGDSGTGKTSLAGSLAELGKIAYMYTLGEEGISSLRGTPWAKNIDLIRLDDPTVVKEVAHTLVQPDHGYVGVVLDSASGLDQMWRRFLLGLPIGEIRDPNQMDVFMEQQTWGRLAELTMDVMVSLYSLASHTRPSPLHVVMTSQVKEYDDERLNIKRVGADVSKGCRTALHSTPDFILHLEIAEDEEADDFDAPAIHRVRLLPDERQVTKTHTDRDRLKKVPAYVGSAQKTLTMSKFFKMMGVPA